MAIFSIETEPKVKIRDKDSVGIGVHTVKRDLKIHIKHSLKILDKWIFKEINILTFLARVWNEPREGGIWKNRIVTGTHVVIEPAGFQACYHVF